MSIWSVEYRVLIEILQMTFTNISRFEAYLRADREKTKSRISCIKLEQKIEKFDIIALICQKSERKPFKSYHELSEKLEVCSENHFQGFSTKFLTQPQRCRKGSVCPF